MPSARAVVVGVLVTAAAGGAALVITPTGDTGDCPEATANVPDGPRPAALGGRWPGPETTGVTDEGALTTVSDQNMNTPGATLQDKLVNGCVEINANNVTVRNVRVVIDAGCSWGINNTGGNTGLVVEDVEIDCGTGDRIGRSAITSENYTATRVHAHGQCENTLWAANNSLIQDTFVDEPMDYVPATDPHTDGVQMGAFSGDNVTVEDSTILGNYVGGSDYGNSAITGDSAGQTNMVLTRNLLAGGGYTVYCATGDSGNWTLTDNVFSKMFVSTYGGFGISTGCADEILSGNIDADTGNPVTLG